MAYAKSDLTREVLGELFSLASGQTPNSDDVTWVEQRIEATLAALSRLNIYYMSDADEVPDEAFNALVTYLAEVCAPKFGRARDKAAQMMAENELRALQRIGGNALNLNTLRADSGLQYRRRTSLF